jgi:hypothetical protein
MFVAGAETLLTGRVFGSVPSGECLKALNVCYSSGQREPAINKRR